MKTIYLHPHNGVRGETPVESFHGAELPTRYNEPPTWVTIVHEGRDFTYSHSSEKHWVFRETLKFRDLNKRL